MGRDVREMFIHCLATAPGWFEGKTGQEKRDEIERWHLAKGWRAIGYDAIIMRDGEVVIGRDLDGDGVMFEDVGAHARGYNTNSVSVALEGGHGSNENDDFYDNFTPAQNAALRQFIADARVQFGPIPIRGHNEVAAKACPGFTVSKWFSYKAPRTSAAQSTSVQAGSGVTLAGCATAAAGAAGVLKDLDPAVQYLLVGGAVAVALLGLWIVKERLRKWAAGDR